MFLAIRKNLRRGISFKLFSAILVLSLVFTFIAAGVRAFQSYEEHIHALDDQMKYIEKSYIPSIIKSLWEMDTEHLQIQLEGILRLPYIKYASIISEDGKAIVSAGSTKFKNRIARRFTLSYKYAGHVVRLGSFEVVADINSVKSLIWKEIYFTLLTEGFKIFLLSLFVLFITHLLITRHLLEMARYARQLNIHENHTPLVLNRHFFSWMKKDELDEVTSALNDVLTNLKKSFEQLTENNLLLEKEIIERKRTEEELRKTEERYRILFSRAGDGIFIMSIEGKLVEVNESFARMHGYQPEEMLKLSLNDFDTPESFRMYPERMRRILDGEALTFEVDHYHKDGHTFPLEVSASLISYTGESYIQCFHRDITDRKRVEEVNRNLQERLQRAEKMEALGQLAGGVAHDLNNVLGILTGYSELLLEEIPEESRARKFVDNILLSTEKGAAIIQDLLTLARRGVPVSDVINFNSVVEGFLKSPTFEKLKDYHSGVVFRVECDMNLLNIKGSPVHLEKTLMNLVSNAAEAVPEKGTVTIHTENRYLETPVRGYDEVEQGDYVVLTISDTGMGIPPEDKEKIFEPFYTKKIMGRSGTGLGLSIVWGTVKDHNGYIDVQTEVGQGTTFMLYFPVTRDELVESKQKVPVDNYMGKGESILVVDDIAEQRDVASRLLTWLGYKVNVASSGEAAVEYVRENKTDIIVLDMIMAPGMDGLETYKKILEIYPRQKAVIVSGFSETDRVREALKSGACVYVKKPYAIEKIGLAIRNELDRNT